MPRKQAVGAKPYDIVLYGATGFTGRQTAEYLAHRAQDVDIQWAVAGRDRAKLEALVESLLRDFPNGGDIGVIVADAADVDAVPKAARVVITTVGPYALYGEPLLRACIEHKADYCDITGETPWVGLMISKYEAAAAAAGVVILNMCGFDSVPADAGTFFLADTARRRLGVGIRSVTAFVRMHGTASGGTLASGANIAASPALQRMVDDPLLLFPCAQVAAAGTGSATSLVRNVPDAQPPAYERAFGAVAVPFFMAAINSRVVRRTAGLLAAYSGRLAGHPHALPTLPAGAATGAPIYSSAAVAASLALAPSRGGGRAGEGASSAAAAAAAAATATTTTCAYSPHEAFAYSERLLLPARFALLGLALGWLVALGLALVRALAAFPGLVRCVRPWLPQPGSGASRARLARSWFHYTLVGQTEGAGAPVVVRVSGGDPGYIDTPIMLVECGLLLAMERSTLPLAALGAGFGGFLTPAVAFGRRLVEALDARGVRFEVLAAGAPPSNAALRVSGRLHPPGVAAMATEAASAAPSATLLPWLQSPAAAAAASNATSTPPRSSGGGSSVRSRAGRGAAPASAASASSSRGPRVGEAREYYVAGEELLDRQWCAFREAGALRGMGSGQAQRALAALRETVDRIVAGCEEPADAAKRAAFASVRGVLAAAQEAWEQRGDLTPAVALADFTQVGDIAVA